MASWHSVRAVVFGPAASPVAWTDLDLSAHVGAQRVLVALKVEVPTSGRYVAVRTNGDAADFRGFGVGAHGVQTVHEQTIDGSTRASLLIVETDAAGVIEWISSVACNVTITLQGWASTTHSGGEVYNAALPAAWTDMDLSAVVGSNIAMALLRVKNDGAAQGIGIRRNGEAYDTLPAASETSACSYASLYGGAAAYLLVETDAAGIVEILRSSPAGSTFVITVEAFAAVGWNQPNVGEKEVFNGALPGAYANLDLTQSTTPAATGLPAVGDTFALAVVHDIVGGQELWNWRTDTDAASWENLSGDSSGASAVLVQNGANLAAVVAMEVESGVVEHEGFFGRNGEVTLAGWLDEYAPTPPTISREYPAAESIVAQDTRISFRLADAVGIDLPTLNVTISTVDETRRLIVAGVWGVDDGVTQASGSMLANAVGGYDIVAIPASELDDRRWLVTVDVDNLGGLPLP